MQQRAIIFLLLILFIAIGHALYAQAEAQPTNYEDFILKKGENIKGKIEKNLFIKVYTDKTSCYVGEPVLATYKLYTRLHSTSKIAKTPSFSGFSVIDLVQPESGISTTLEHLEGRDYYVYIIRKAQLYPYQPGITELEAASVENTVSFAREEALSRPNSSSPEFLPGVSKDEAMFDTVVSIENKPVLINVKPLPEKGKPDSFAGAVGNFMIDAFVEKDSFATDDAGRMKVMLSGKGNITLVAAPEIAWPKGLDGYEPTIKDGVNKLAVPVSGSKIFDYAFTAAKEGDYTIPPVSFNFFDVVSGKYKMVSTKPFTIHVIKGKGRKPLKVATENNSQQESFAHKIFTHRWMIVLPVALLVITGLLFWLKADKKKQNEKLLAAALQQKEAERNIPDSITANPMEQTASALFKNDVKQFYKTLDKELHVFLAQKLHLSPEGISKKAIADKLDKTGVPLSDSLAIQKLLEDIGMQLYTPVADENKMQEYYVEAVRLVNILNKT